MPLIAREWFRGQGISCAVPRRAACAEESTHGASAECSSCRKYFRAAQGILEALTEHERKGGCKKSVRHNIEKPHSLLFHRINETAAVNELGFISSDSVVKFRQLFRRRRQVGVENHQNLFCGQF